MRRVLILLVIFFLGMISCEKENNTRPNVEEKPVTYAGKKVLIVHSYHPELKGVKLKNQGLKKVFDSVSIEYKIIYMDTKRNVDEAFKVKASLKAKQIIEQYNPDVVVVFDDNALKYLVVPFFKNSELPFVFAGIDWDASMYGLPFKNVTGMVSVELVPQMLEYIQNYAQGSRIGWLGYDTFSSRKQTKAYQDVLKINMSTHYVKNFTEWKDRFIKLQSEVDMIIHSGILAGMENWNEQEAKQFVLNHIKVPVGTLNELMMCCSLFGLVKVVGEQGEWVAGTALEIIGGKKPSEIEITWNKIGKVFINLDVAEKLDVAFGVKILKNSQVY